MLIPIRNIYRFISLRIFLSHSGDEKQLATALKDWIENNFKNIKCFCTSTPGDIGHGNDWRNQIEKEVRKNNIILLLFSLDTLTNPWLHLEAGIALGAYKKAKIIPAVYGGVKFDDIPNTISNRQGLNLQDDNDFNAFVQTFLLNGKELKNNQTRQALLNTHPEIQRIILYGRIGNEITNKTEIVNLDPITFDLNNESIEIPLTRQQKQLISARIKIRPRRTGVIAHWKCGLSFERLIQQNQWKRVFEFHSSHHNGSMTWTLYAEENQMDGYSIPAHLDQEKQHEVQIWFSADMQAVTCIGFDDQRKRTILKDDRGSEKWRPDFRNIKRLILKGWADKLPFRVDVDSIELEYLK